MPRYARPGGYTQTTAAANPYAQAPGLLGLLMGQGTNPIYQTVAPILNDLGAGLLSGNSWSDGLSKAVQVRAQQAPYRAQQRAAAYEFEEAQKVKDNAARSILNAGPDYQDIADAVANGTMEARDGWNMMFKRKSDARAAAELEARNQQFAQFIQDPTLKGLVEAGAMDAADAYKLEHPTANPGNTPASIQEYEYAKANGYQGSFADWLATKGGSGGGDWGTAILPGLDANGNLVPLRAAPGGNLAQAAMPEGVRYAPDALAGARTGATYDAKAAATARAALPAAQTARAVTDNALAEIRRNAAGMQEWFGQWGPRGMYVNPSSEMGKFVTATKNANSQAFMQARNMLKGGGQITDYEGRRAEDAYSRMQAAMDTGDQEQYLRAIADFEAAVVDGYNKLVEAAQGSYSAGGAGITGGYTGPDYKSKYGLE